MPMDHARHADEQRVIEDHAQTAQKLTFFRGYAGAWGNILAQARLPVPITDLFYIDTHCGAGRHASREHPDQGVLGTPLIACHEARRLQRRYPRLKVHVRAVDNDRRWIAHLRQRVQPFLQSGHERDRVDVQLFPEPFEKMLPKLLNETISLKAPSLWLIDPYGLKNFDSRSFPFHMFLWAQRACFNRRSATSNPLGGDPRSDRRERNVCPL